VKKYQTSVLTRATQRNIPEDTILHLNRDFWQHFRKMSIPKTDVSLLMDHNLQQLFKCRDIFEFSYLFIGLEWNQVHYH
jgi:hypothetical protein